MIISAADEGTTKDDPETTTYSITTTTSTPIGKITANIVLHTP